MKPENEKKEKGLIKKEKMMGNYVNEMKEVAEWLSHPNELGKAPSKMEFVKEFTDEDEIHCLIFKFKKGLFSPWMMAIHSDSGIFSEQERYDEADDIGQAKKMLTYLKQYWKSIALNEEEKKEREEKAAGFQAFILKAAPVFEPDLFLQIYEEDWGEKIQDSADSDEEESTKEGVDARIYCTDDGMRLTLGYMNFPVPGDEAVECAKYNYMWRDGADIVATHTAQEIVIVSGGSSVRERAMFYAKVVSTLCKMKNTIGLYTNGIVYEPKMVVKVCELIKDDELPLPVLVWSGIGKEEDGFSGWTDGMKQFGFEEMEIMHSQQEPKQLQAFMLLLIDYCINNNIGFHDGEVVGLTAGIQLRVEKSKGFNVDEDGETLKLFIL